MGYYSGSRGSDGDTYLLNAQPDSQSWWTQDRMYGGPNAFGQYTVGYVFWNVWSATASSAIYIFDASIQMYVGWGSGGDTFWWGTAPAYNEDQATWNNIIPNVAGQGSGIGTPVDGFFSFGVDRTLVQPHVASNNQMFAIQWQPNQDSRSMQIISRDYAGQGSTYAPTLSFTYGYNLQSLSTTVGNRSLTIATGSVPSQDSCDVQLKRTSDNAVIQSQNVGPAGQVTFSNITPGNYYAYAAAYYNGKGNTAWTSAGMTNIVIANGTSPTPTLANTTAGPSNLLLHKSVTASTSPFNGSTLHQYELFNGATSYAVSGDTSATTWVQYNVPDSSTWNVKVRHKYADGTYTAWSAASTNVTTSTPAAPAITLTPTSGVDKSLTASWSIVPSAVSYDIYLIKNGVNQTLQNVTTTSKTFYDVSAGTPTGTTYLLYVKAIFNNTYTTHGEAIVQNTSTGAQQPTLPTPPAPSATGNSPFKKAVRVTTGPGVTTTNGTASNGYDTAIDGGVGTPQAVGNNAKATWFNRADGNHTVQWRYKWADGDISAWSAVSNTVVTDTPVAVALTIDTSVTQTFKATWTQATDPNADGYTVTYNAGAPVVQTPISNTSYTATSQTSGSKSITVANHYSIPSGETAKYGDNGEVVPSVTQSGTVGLPTPAAPTALGDTPYRRAIRVTPQSLPAAFNSAASWDVQILRASDGAVFDTQLAKTTANIDFATGAGYNQFPDGSYVAKVRANWANGDLSSWSAPSTAVTVSTPTITGTTSSQSNIRSITVTWDRIADAASYDVTLAGTGGSTVNVVNPGTGATVSTTWNNVKSGSHAVTVTPKYTNGYVGNVNVGTATGNTVLPTPSAPTAVGDSPAKRQIRATAPSTVAAFYTAQYWEFQRDSATSSGNQTTTTYDFSQVPQGAHDIKVRAKWADGDISNWSASSALVNTTSPSPTGVTSRQRNAPTAASLTTTAATGGTIPANSYYVAVSINKGGNAATDAAAPAGETARVVNESTPSPLATQVTTGATSTITVPRPVDQIVAGDTWNVYIGTDRNQLKRVQQNIAQATASVTLTSYTAPTQDDSKTGKSDLLWVAPTGVADAPLYYKVERAPAVPNTSTGAAGSYVDVTSSGNVVFYASNLKFLENKLDTKWWYYKVSAVYTGDTSAAVEIIV